MARWAGGAAAAAALAGGALALNRHLVGVFYDDGLYAGLALALARGAGYVHLHLPDAPAAVHYPPLYPLLLAPIFGTLPVDAAALVGKLVNLALGTVAAGLIAWHAARARLLGPAPWWLAAVVVAASTVAIPVLTVQAVLFSEPLWSALFAGAIVVADRPPRRLTPAAAYAVAGGLAALALLTRTIGVAAGVGLPLFLLAVRRESWRRVLVLVAPVGLAGLGWGLWVAAHRAGIDPAVGFSYGGYGEVFRQAGLSFLTVSLPDLPRPLAAITLAWLPAGLPRVAFGAAALALVLLGLAVLVRRSSVGGTLLLYLAIVGIWPYVPDRFLWAVLPWLGLALAAGAVEAWRRRRLQLPVALVVAAVAFGYARYEGRGLAGHTWDAAARAISDNFRELVPGLEALPPDAVIASDDEALVWLYTGRRAVPLALFAWRGRVEAVPDPRDHRAYLERQRVTHVLLASATGGTARQLRALIAAYPGWLVPIRGWPGGRWLFEVRDHRPA
ncbi:MAG: hypothetical protein ACREL9_13510 [Gemmatimonadales bacterium]